MPKKTIAISRSWALLSVLIIGCNTGVALAGTATATFQVSAKVVNACTISTTPTMAFPDYSATTTNPTIATDTITVLCTNNSGYKIGLNGGVNGDVKQRKMIDGKNTLDYNIYTTSADTTIWGDLTGTIPPVSGTGTGSAQTYTAWGAIPPSQNSVPAGTYSDTITATISY